MKTPANKAESMGEEEMGSSVAESARTGPFPS